ncbi:hypothetical protein HaLaN_05467 [Haematococcus lacustris]|uniref:Uncharacterized protein n=1 Tax=Haematococcus lacustris TaxID=44745 RepID=A0A699YTC6_HAELA|nr:hypothetical protein HaLaN_05467 [Haematococcus lacustris]
MLLLICLGVTLSVDTEFSVQAHAFRPVPSWSPLGRPGWKTPQPRPHSTCAAHPVDGPTALEGSAAGLRLSVGSRHGMTRLYLKAALGGVIQ